jgi:hypothetical protein
MAPPEAAFTRPARLSREPPPRGHRYERRAALAEPDGILGRDAHAAVAGLALLTRDATRYRTYFPGLEIIAP